MGRMVGIDLGTTNTVVAIVDGPRPRVLDTREGKPQFRSVVGIKRRRGRGGNGAAPEILVGDAAVDNWGMAPEDTILSVKRLMGRGMGDPEVMRIREWAQFSVVAPREGTGDSLRVVMGGEEYSPVDISAMILRKAKEDAEFRLGEEVTHAVITVPAYFSQIQRDATRRAGLKAGLRVIKILEEPTAAAIAFGTDSGDETPRTLLVYDLGGGTFDVSLLMMAGDFFAPLNLEGDMWLGGDSLDQVIVDHAVRWIRREFGVDPTDKHRFMAHLRAGAQGVKERLSSAGSTDLVIAGMLQDDDGNLIDVDMEITREQMERMILPLVGRYRECTCGSPNLPDADACSECGRAIRELPVLDGKALRIVKKALANANQSPDQVDHVIMAGNSTTVPLVQRSMEELFGAEKVLRKVHPKHSVALGAAIVAAWAKGKIVCQAPDPAEPRRECGHVNDPDAGACEKCGALLVFDDGDETRLADGLPGQGGEAPSIEIRVGQVGGIAPFHYGTQTAGDEFHAFIHKGDPFPTEEPRTLTFYTQSPDQRMVSIPVYGGDDLGRASANQLQGSTFALLPPGLPDRTPIRVRMRLDRDGVFQIEAHLQDGTDLKPWIVKGEDDAGALAVLDRVEMALAEKGDAVDPDVVSEVRKRRERVYGKMKVGDFAGAAREAEAMEQEVRQAADRDQREGVRRKAENMVGYAELILQEYAWALTDADQVYRLGRLVGDARDALRSGDEAALQRATDALDRATDDVPPFVQLFMNMKGAIFAKVRPVDPPRAARLSADVTEMERRLKNGDLTALEGLDALVVGIAAAMEEAEAARTGKVTCQSCGKEKPPRVRCPHCGADPRLLSARAG